MIEKEIKNGPRRLSRGMYVLWDVPPHALLSCSPPISAWHHATMKYVQVRVRGLSSSRRTELTIGLTKAGGYILMAHTSGCGWLSGVDGPRCQKEDYPRVISRADWSWSLEELLP